MEPYVKLAIVIKHYVLKFLRHSQVLSELSGFHFSLLFCPKVFLNKLYFERTKVTIQMLGISVQSKCFFIVSPYIKSYILRTNMLVRSAWTGPPAPAHKLALAGTPAQPRFAPLQEKNIRHGG